MKLLKNQHKKEKQKKGKLKSSSKTMRHKTGRLNNNGSLSLRSNVNKHI